MVTRTKENTAPPAGTRPGDLRSPAKAHGARLAPDQGGIRVGLPPRARTTVPARKKTSEVSAWFRVLLKSLDFDWIGTP